eukprot:1378845-Pleurochrysis_carterae.AAC.1
MIFCRRSRDIANETFVRQHRVRTCLHIQNGKCANFGSGQKIRVSAILHFKTGIPIAGTPHVPDSDLYGCH